MVNTLAMDRRSLLKLAACFPAVAQAPASACSIALKTPQTFGQQNQVVYDLFQTWWKRDAEKFRAYFSSSGSSGRTTSSLGPESGTSVRSLSAASIFVRFFSDERKLKRITFILNSDAGLIVGCSEVDPSRNIGPDCRGVPMLHLFLVSMSGMNPQTVNHCASTRTTAADRFSIWSAGSA